MPYAPTLPEQPSATEYRTALAGAAEYLSGLRATPADQRGDTFAVDFDSARDFINEVDPILTALERATPPAARGGVATSTEVEHRDRNLSVGQRLTESDEYRNNHGSFGSGYHEFQVEGPIASAESRATIQGGSVGFTYNPTDAGGIWRPLGTPVPPQVRQLRLFIRDLLPVIQTGLGAIPYIQELNPATNETGATAVQEGNQKPEVTMQWTPKLAPIVTIAAWVPVTTQILEDAPTLQGYIDTRLSYMLALREEAQILNGGGGVNISGIRQDPNIQTQAVVSGDFPAVIGNAIGKIENVDLEADFVAVNPLNFWTAMVTRHATEFDNGGGGGFVGAPAVQVGITWGTAALRTRAMESGKAIVGSSMGATIADRMQSNIKFGNQHSDFFTGNKVAVLAEERVGLLLQRPDGFVLCDVPTT